MSADVYKSLRQDTAPASDDLVRGHFTFMIVVKKRYYVHNNERKGGCISLLQGAKLACTFIIVYTTSVSDHDSEHYGDTVRIYHANPGQPGLAQARPRYS